MVGFALSGILVGFGSKLGNGCTSGHGVCGLPRFSLRSWTFIILMMVCSISFANIFKAEHLFSPAIKEEIVENHSLVFVKVISISGFILLNTTFIYLILKSLINQFYSYFVTFLVAFTFALGLIISGFVKRSKVINFLVFDKNWDPSLGIILGTVFTMNYFFFKNIFKQKKPFLKENFTMPSKNKVDFKLVMGGCIFGLGWAISGICPGPALLLFQFGTL